MDQLTVDGALATAPALAPARPRPPQRFRWQLALLLGPALLVGLAVAVTLLLIAYVSLLQTFPGPTALTLTNYAAFLTNPYLIRAAINTIALGCVSTILCALLGYPVAWYFTMSRNRHGHIVFIAVLAPLMVSIVVRVIGWTVILGNEGMINDLLRRLHLIDTPIPMMQSFWSIVAGSVHVLLPFMILSITSVLGKIDKSALEAAMVLGATRARAFWLIALPLSIQGVATGAIICFCLTVGAFLTPLWLGRGSVPVLALTVRQQVLDFGDWPGGAVQSFMLAVGTFALIGLVSRAVSHMARR